MKKIKKEIKKNSCGKVIGISDFDARGNVVSSVDSIGNVSYCKYDGNNNIIYSKYDDREVFNTYDDYNNITSKIIISDDIKIQITYINEYDNNGKLIYVHSIRNDGYEDEEFYEYYIDRNIHEVKILDKDKKVISIDKYIDGKSIYNLSNNIESFYDYDDKGRIIKIEHRPTGSIITYKYYNNMTMEIHSNGETITSIYNDDGLLVRKEVKNDTHYYEYEFYEN